MAPSSIHEMFTIKFRKGVYLPHPLPSKKASVPAYRYLKSFGRKSYFVPKHLQFHKKNTYNTLQPVTPTFRSQLHSIALLTL